MKSAETKVYTDAELKICQAVPEILGEDVMTIEQTFEGEFNQVYIVGLKNKKVVVKIFMDADSPAPGKDSWVSELLQIHAVPHAELLYYSRESKYFQHGLAIFAYIPGANAKQALASGSLTDEDFAKEQGRLLKKIHAISLDHYGFEDNRSFLPFMIDPILETANQSFVQEHGLEAKITAGVATVRNILNKYAKRCSPVLVHGDCGAKNTIINPSIGHVLIDWDNCGGNIWLRDYAYLLFWLENNQTARPQIDAFQSAFFEGYGIPQDFSREEIAELVRALHIRQAIQLLPYYLDERTNAAQFASVKNLLFRLMNE